MDFWNKKKEEPKKTTPVPSAMTKSAATTNGGQSASNLSNNNQQNASSGLGGTSGVQMKQNLQGSNYSNPPSGNNNPPSGNNNPPSGYNNNSSGYNNQAPGYNNQTSNNTANRYGNTSGPQNQPAGNIDALVRLLDEICRTRKNEQFVTLKQVLFDTDAYEERVYDLWELQIIFSVNGKFNAKLFSDLHDMNNAEAALLKDQIQLKWMAREIQSFNSKFQNWVLPQQSKFLDKFARLSPTAVKMAQELVQNRDVSYDPKVAWEKFFGANEMKVDQQKIRTALMKEIHISNVQDSEVQLVIDEFFTLNEGEFQVSKISFVKALKHYQDFCKGHTLQRKGTVHQQPAYLNQSVGQPPVGQPPVNNYAQGANPMNASYNSQGQPNQPFTAPYADPNQNQSQFNAPHGQGTQYQAPGQPAPYGAPAQGAPYQAPGQPAHYGSPANGFSSQPEPYQASGQGSQYQAPGQPAPYGAPAQGAPYQAHGQQHPPNHSLHNQQSFGATNPAQNLDPIVRFSQALMNRGGIKAILSDYNLQVQNVKGRNMCSNIVFEQFLMNMSFNSTEARALSQKYEAYGSPGQVDLTSLEAELNQVQQSQRFEQVLATQSMNVQHMLEGLKRRHSGVFKWFQPFARGGTTLSIDDFSRAIQSMNVMEIQPHDYQKIFDAFDVDRQRSVTLASVDGVFKAFIKRASVQTDHIMTSIIKAFNCDDFFLQTKLGEMSRSNFGLPVEEFIRFFQTFADAKRFYTPEEITLIGEKFAFNQGQVEVNSFLTDFRRVRDAQHIQKDLKGFNGIQNTLVQSAPITPAPAYMNPLMPNFKSNCTSAETRRIPKRIDIRPRTDQQKLEDLVKSASLSNKVVEDLFNRSMRIMRNDFTNMVLALRLDWHQYDIDQLFTDIDTSMHQSSPELITAQEIDEFVHHALQTNLQQMHDALLKAVYDSTMKGNFDLIAEVKRQPGGQYGGPQTECTVDQLRNALRFVGVQMREKDSEFFAKKYLTSAQNQVSVSQLQDDLNQMKRSSAGTRQGPADFRFICESLAKKMFVAHQSIASLLSTNSMSDQIQERDFIAIFERQLGPLVSHHDLQSLFQAVDRMRMGSVTSADILRFIESNSKSPTELKMEIVMKLKSQVNQFKSLIQNNREYTYNQGFVRTSSIVQILCEDLRLSTIDAEFIASFFSDHNNNTDTQKLLEELGAGGLSTGYKSDSQRQAEDVIKRVGAALMATNSNLVALLRTDPNFQRTNKMDTTSFLRLITTKLQAVKLSFNEEDALRKEYALNDPTMRDAFDVTKFQESLRKVTVSGTANAFNTMTKEQQLFYKNMQGYIAKNPLKKTLITAALKRIDRNNSGFVAERDFAQAFIEMKTGRILTVQEAQNLPPGGLGREDLNKLTSVLQTNREGRFNYKTFLQLICGSDEEGEELFLMPLATLEKVAAPSAGAATFIMPTTVRGPASREFGGIGEKLIRSGRNYEDLFRAKVQRGPSGALMCTEADVNDVLRQLNVQLYPDERSALQASFYQGPVSLAQFLGSLGLPAQTIGVQYKGAIRKVLTNEELDRCQKAIQVYKRDLVTANLSAETFIDLLKKQGKRDLTFDEFRNYFTKNVSQVNKGLFTETLLANLVHYLARDVPTAVNIDKLYLAFQQNPNDPPLQQDGVEELKKKQDLIKAQISKSEIDFLVIDLFIHMRNTGISTAQMFDLLQSQANDNIPIEKFKAGLEKNAFQSKDLEKLIMLLDTAKTRKTVNMKVLNTWLTQLRQKEKPADSSNVQTRFGKMDANTRRKIETISDYMVRNNITTETLHQQLDSNHDGSVDLQEFVVGMQRFNIPGLMAKDYNYLFNQIDQNNNAQVSLNEFSLYIQGAKLQRQHKLNQLDAETKRELESNMQELFDIMDTDKSRSISADEIMLTMKSIGHSIDKAKAQRMIAEVTPKAELDLELFKKLMMPIMEEELLKQDTNSEKYRQLFVEADTDYSGFLSIDELYIVLRKQGVAIEIEDLCELMLEFDCDSNTKLDIDEFITMMEMGDQMTFSSQKATQVYHKIQMGRKLSVTDFLKIFKNVPVSFSPSVIGKNWENRKNLPSDSFKVKVDPRTMLWKDLYSAGNDLIGEYKIAGQVPLIRPIPTSIGSLITLDGAQGVPLPPDDKNFSRASVVKRAVRIGLFDTIKREFVHNTVQIPASWNANAEDVWVFGKPPETFSQVVFRSTEEDSINQEAVKLIFELVLYKKVTDAADCVETTEISCGWGEVDVGQCNIEETKKKIPIQGGSPLDKVDISSSDVHQKRKGLQAISKMFQSNISSQITISFKTHKNFPADLKYHVDLLPSTCLVQSKLVPFISAYRNKAGGELLKDSAVGTFKKPGGSVLISCLPKILDNPDIVETLMECWNEDTWTTLTVAQKKNIELLSKKVKEYVHRLYPVLFSDEFAYSASNATKSMCANWAVSGKRRELLLAALRFNMVGAKGQKIVKPIEQLTTFKPFNVREIEYDVWDSLAAKQDQIVRQFDDMGLLEKNLRQLPVM